MNSTALAATTYRIAVVGLLGVIAYGVTFKPAEVRVVQEPSERPAAEASDAPMKVEIVNTGENPIPIELACAWELSKVGACPSLPVEVKNRAVDAVYVNVIEPHPLEVFSAP